MLKNILMVLSVIAVIAPIAHKYIHPEKYPEPKRDDTMLEEHLRELKDLLEEVRTSFRNS